jgi:hypothetical protein
MSRRLRRPLCRWSIPGFQIFSENIDDVGMLVLCAVDIGRERLSSGFPTRVHD